MDRSRKPVPATRNPNRYQAPLSGSNAWGVSPTDRPSSERASLLIEGAADKWAAVLSLVVRAQLGITLSATRDGGALSITLLSEDGPQKRYCATPEELDAALGALTDHLTALAL
jgi:hypothetical protein